MSQLGLLPTELPALIPALTLSQPFGGLCAAVPPGKTEALKALETRLFQIHYRGPLVILAGREPHPLHERIWFSIPAWARPLCELRGVALCLVDVVGCRPLRAEDEPRSWFWDPAEKKTRWAWEFANVRRLAPVPVRGRQGLALKLKRTFVEDALRRAPR